MMKRALHRLGLYHPLRDARRDWRFWRKSRAAMKAWRATGEPVPPPDCVKYRCIARYARASGCRTLIETGTFYGDAVFALRRVFQEIHTIELAPGLYELNRREFAHLSHVHVHLGDSAGVLPTLAPRFGVATLFWLDGHFCAGPSARADKDTPICEELAFLLQQAPSRHVVLIDDARLFNGKDGYPSVDEIRHLVRASRPDATVEVRDDIIRIYPV